MQVHIAPGVSFHDGLLDVCIFAPRTLTDVAAVVCTSGTTNAGIIDDLDSVGALAQERGWWFHVDGAYGGAGIFAPSLRGKYAGLERADSFILDPHKWMFTPFDCCALLYADPAKARRTHTQDASYLDVIHDHDAWNPTDYAYHLTRRARGLPLWFSLAVHGVGAYRDAIGHFAPGDVADLDSDVEHQPVTVPGVPCICVAATDAPLRFSGWMARMLQPLFKL